MDIVKDFYSLSKIAQSVRLGATSKTDSMLKMVRNNQLANKSWQWGDMNKGQEVI